MEYTADDVLNMRNEYLKAETTKREIRQRMEEFLSYVGENGCLAWTQMFADINKIKDAFAEYVEEGGSYYSYSGICLRMNKDSDVEISIVEGHEWFWLNESIPFALSGVPLDALKNGPFYSRNEKITQALMKLVVDWEYVFPEICETLYHHFESKEADLSSNSGEINFYLDNIEEREKEEREER